MKGMKGGQIFALVTGIMFLLVGVMGFFPQFVSQPDVLPGYVAANGTESGFGYILGFIPTNLVHNIVRIAVGGFGIFSSIALDSSRYYARFVAVSYGLFAVLGLIPVANVLFGIMPIYGSDVLIHGLSAAGATYFGFFAEPGIQEAYAQSEDRANQEAAQSR
jgi:hypothetical protein